MSTDWTESRTIEWVTRVFHACTRSASLFEPAVFDRVSAAIAEGIPHDRLTMITYDATTKELRIAASAARNDGMPPQSQPDATLFTSALEADAAGGSRMLIIDDPAETQPAVEQQMRRDQTGSCALAALALPAGSPLRAWLSLGWQARGQASRADVSRINRIVLLMTALVPAAHNSGRALRFTQMLDRLPHGVIALGSGHNVLEANRAARVLLATGDEDSLGRSFDSMLDARSQALYRAAIATGRSPADLVLEILTPAGAMPVDVIVSRVEDDPAVARQLHLQDARQRLADQAELESRAEALAFLRELAEHVAGELNADRALERITQLITTRLPVRGAAIARSESDEGRFALVAANGFSRQAVDALTQLRVSEVLMLPGDGSAEIPPSLQQALGADRPSMLVPLRHADRVVGIALFSASSRISPNTRELLLAGTRTIAVALHASIEFFEVARLAAERRQLLDSIPSMVFRLDPRTGETMYANAAVERVLGTPLDRAIGFPGIEGLLADEAERQAMAHTRERVASGAESHWADRRFLHQDGRSLVLRTRLYRVRAIGGFDDGSGALLIEGIAQDVTDEMEARKQLVQADRLASLGMLAAGVAHEINNPTAFISLGVQQLARMITQMPDEPEASGSLRRRMNEVVTELADGVQRIVQIVGELKLFARIPESAFSTPVDVNRLITSAVTLARSELRNKAIVEVDLGELPPLPGDHARLGQVFVNLLINAAQAIPPGNEGRNRVVVRTRAFDGYVQVEVSDTGVGIPREDLPRIFDPFFTTKAPGEGTGLGLAISFDLIKRSGGTIDVVSEVARGTTFCVKLPVRHFVPPRGSRPVLGNTRPGGRVLVVEDEHHLGVAVARALATSYMVELAPDAMTALERIEAGGGTEYHAVLCDLRMPGMNGKELYEAVQQRWPSQATRFIFLTGAGFGGEFEAFIRGTDRPVIEKPFEMSELEERVAEMVASKQ